MKRRIVLYAFGSSVAWGFPYAPRCDVTTIVSQTWHGSVGGHPLQTRNEAQYGRSSAYVVERARSIAQDPPHGTGHGIAMVYSGNNEFLHLEPPVESGGRGPALMTEIDHEHIVESHYRNLDAAITELRRAHVDVVLSTIPVNLLDWPPTYTVLDGLEPAHAEEALQRSCGDTDYFERLLGSCSSQTEPPAQLCFLLGRQQMAMGRTNDARKSLILANDVDGRPIRATTLINRNIRELAGARSTRLLDAETDFAVASAEGICGNGQFWDDCHPGLEGYVRLADLLNGHLADAAGVRDAPRPPSTDAVAQHHTMDEAFLADVHGRMGLYCYKHANCWDSTRPLDLAERYLDVAAATLDSVEVYVARALVHAHRGLEPAVRENLRHALRIDRGRALWLVHGREVRSALALLGLTDPATWIDGLG